MAKIKVPCPKCGGEGHTRSQRFGEDVIDVWAECISCGAKTDAWETHSGGLEYHEAAASDFAQGNILWPD
jgi:ssDNA-binding Zn-finger/Zn-ribbon topoisomerase 1